MGNNKIVIVITDGVLEEILCSDPNMTINYYNIDTDEIYGDRRDALEKELSADKEGLQSVTPCYAAEPYYEEPRFDLE